MLGSSQSLIAHSQFFKDPFVTLLEHSETGLLGIGGREWLGDRRGTHLTDYLPDGMLAQGANLQRSAINGPPQFKTLRTDATTSLRIFRFCGKVFVDWHSGAEGTGCSQTLSRDSAAKIALPARLCHAGNHPCGSELTECDARHLEATQVSAATSGQNTAVYETGWACVTRKHRKTDIVFLLLQLVTEFVVSSDGLRLTLVSGFPAFSCHWGEGDTASLARYQEEFRQFFEKPLLFDKYHSKSAISHCNHRLLLLRESPTIDD